MTYQLESANPLVRTRVGYDRSPRWIVTDARTGQPLRFLAGDIVEGAILDADENRLGGVSSADDPATAAIVNYDGGLFETRLTQAVAASVTTPSAARWLEAWLLRDGERHELGLAPLRIGPDIT